MNSGDESNGFTGNGMLEAAREFWNRNPCDGHEDLQARMAFRYRKEPWLPVLLEAIAARHTRIIEVGCGQGTDALYCCSRLKPDASYTAIDYSDESLAMARKSAREYAKSLVVSPQFMQGNAEALDLPDAAFDCVLSIGVIHHTPDITKALAEIRRILAPDGHAYILIYRWYAPKVLAAHLIRFVSRIIDRIAGRKNVLYTRSQRLGTNHFLGTMIHECLGVPILNSYTRGQVRRLFSDFAVQSVMPVGIGLPNIGINHWFDKGFNPLGALWLIRARKS